MRGHSRLVVVLSLSLGLGVAASASSTRVAAEDLQTDSTTKVLSPDPGTTTLTPSGPTTKPGAPVGSGPANGPSSSPASPPVTERRAPPIASAPPADDASATAPGDDASSAPAVAPPQASASARASSRGPLLFERRSISLGAADLAVSLRAPKDWPELAKERLPEVAPNPDVTLAVERGFGVHDPLGSPPDLREVVIACGKGSAEYWADNIRDAAFTEMIAAVESEAKKYSDLSSIDPDPQRPAGSRIEQPFAAEAKLSGPSKAKQGNESAKLQGLSFLGFYKDGSTTNVLACTITCANVVEGNDPGVCGDVIGSIEVSGSFVPAPKRSWLAQSVFALKQNPTVMWLAVIGGVFALLLLILVPLLLLRRRRSSATGEHDGSDDHDADDEHDDGYDEGYEAGLAAARAQALAAVEGLTASAPPPDGYYDPTTLARRG